MRAYRFDDFKSLDVRQRLEDVVHAMTILGLKPVINRVFKFEEAREAFEHLPAAHFADKMVIRLPDYMS